MTTHRNPRSVCAWSLWALVTASTLSAAPATADDQHPFILWTSQEAAAIRQTVQREPWAGQPYRALEGHRARGNDLAGLFRYAVMDEKAAGEAEKKLLLDSIRDGRVRGDYVTPLRYDCLYDLLGDGERQTVERALRAYVRGAMESIKGRRWNRFNWLPNLQYPWYLSAHLMAASLRDKALMREIFEAPFGLKWYLDEYLSDQGFYNEEFGKMYNTPDAILLWGRACRRLEMDEIGFGYRGRQGATIQGHIESVLRIGMPRVDLGTSRPHYPRLSIGDAKGSRGVPAYGFQHYLVAGYLEHRYAGRPYHKWGLGEWSWFELAHAAWPDAGFDYFLAQRRPPDEELYRPSLLFGLDPIDPQKVSPPPARSGVYPGRGLVVLRAEEGPAYWESPAPAVGMRLAAPYAHHVQDCFCLTGFYAYNRPLYVNRKHATNYSGVDPGFSNSSRSHSTVVVDFEEPKTIGQVDLRHGFSEHFKFVAARGQGIYDDVDQTRALVLTRDYLLDVFQLKSDRPRHYQWIVQGLGHAYPGEPQRWTSSRDLVGYLFNLGGERSLHTDQDWAVTLLQSSGGAHRRFSGLGAKWFDERIGCRITMFGEPGTAAYVARSPVVSDTSGKWRGKDRFCFGEDEPAAAAVVATRRCPETTFVAIHEPFRGRHYLRYPRRVKTDDADIVAVSMVVFAPSKSDEKPARTTYRDYLMIDLGDDVGKSVTVDAGTAKWAPEKWRFVGFAFARITDTKIDVTGDVSGMVYFDSAEGRKLVLNGKPTPMRKVGSFLEYGDLKAPPPDRGRWGGVMIPPPPTELATRWIPDGPLCLPTGGSATRTLRLWNQDHRPGQGAIYVKPSAGLRAEPAEIVLKDFAPGQQREITITVVGDGANRLGHLRLMGDGSDCPRERQQRLIDDKAPGVMVGPSVLPVAQGVCVRRGQVWPGDFAATIYSRRYIAKVYYMDSGATSLLLDPLGLRRSDSSGASYPQIVRFGTDDRGREGWRAENVPKFPYFVPVVIPNPGEKPAHVYEAGWHAHGSRSAMEHRFTEDWIVVRFLEAKPGERIALSWHPQSRKNGLAATIMGRDSLLAREKMPGKVIVATPSGKHHDAGDPDQWPRRANLPREVDQITAVFHRPHGYQYGSVMLYPEGARREKDYVTQPGDKPMGFTFATEEEFPTVLKRWRENPPPVGPSEEERDIYGAAFMPHLKRGN